MKRTLKKTKATGHLWVATRDDETKRFWRMIDALTWLWARS